MLSASAQFLTQGDWDVTKNKKRMDERTYKTERQGQLANSHVSLPYDQLYCLNSEGIERDKLYRIVDGWVEEREREQGKVSWLRGCWGKEKKWGERLKEERGSRKLCSKSADPRLGHVILISQRKKEKKTRVSGRQNKKRVISSQGLIPENECEVTS